MIKTIKTKGNDFAHEYVFLYNDYIGASVMKKGICQGGVEYVEIPADHIEMLYEVACCEDISQSLLEHTELDYVSHVGGKLLIDNDSGYLSISTSMTRNLIANAI